MNFLKDILKTVRQKGELSKNDEISENENCLFSLKEQNNDQPITVTSLQNQVSIQHVNVKIENYKTKVVLDTVSVIHVMKEETFNNIKNEN